VPAVICPIETLQVFFSEKGIPLFVDGAHAINQVEVNMAQLKPAAYFSNFHKWSYTPKNAAFLYISDKFLSIIRPVLTGNLYGQGAPK
jgi:selenocysteine lyase/cysteine desulfurase